MDITTSNHPLFKVLKGHILHCTSPANYKVICEDGYIKANNKSFPFTWGETEGSCVHKIGGISLLDFGLPENKIFFATDQENFDYPWESILIAHRPLTIIIKINRDKICDKILTWEKIRKKTEKCLLIPYTEVCSLEPIPTSLFEGIVLVKSVLDSVVISEDYLSKEFLQKL